MIGIVFSTASTAIGSAASTVDASVDRATRAFFAVDCRAGLSMAVVDTRNPTPRFYNYGRMSRATGKRPTSKTLYEIASVTKTFTGVAAAAAVQSGRMTLDADFRKYLAGDYPNLQLNGRPISLRTLAAHTSGMPRDIPDTDAIMKDPDIGRRPERLLALERGISPSDFPSALNKVALRSTPGSDEQYSNAAMKVIAMGLEHVYGAEFSTLLSREVFVPLHMRDTVFTLSDVQRRRLAVGYDRAGRPAPYHTPNAGASWGLYSSTADMARYVAWHLNEKNPVVAQAHAVIEGDAVNGKGMIWNEGMEHGERILWHGGGSFGMSSQVVLYPDSGQGFVLLANDTCEGTEGALKDIASDVHVPVR